MEHLVEQIQYKVYEYSIWARNIKIGFYSVDISFDKFQFYKFWLGIWEISCRRIKGLEEQTVNLYRRLCGKQDNIPMKIENTGYSRFEMTDTIQCMRLVIKLGIGGIKIHFRYNFFN